MNTLIKDLEGMTKGNQFKPFVKKIVFPQFKNLMPDSVIHFEFPLTVFVGQNGSGKSSCLYALHGAPDGVSVQKHWFSTSMDPIPSEIDGRRASFAYDYIDEQGVIKENVFYMRIYKKEDPDYWETTPPSAKYGLNTQKKRTPPVKMNTIYIDFRSILSSFDKYMNFLWESHKISSSRNNFLRKAARKLQNVFIGFGHYSQGSSKDIFELPSDQLQAVNLILGKEYKRCQILRHKFHREYGETIKFHIEDSNSYSDAFAGSGEISIVQIVTSLKKASPSSLIILDEPEVSLHPGAQKELLKFLLQEIKAHKHQVIISTHSPFLVEQLPKTAIKVFRNHSDGKFEILENVSPENAFYRIGHNTFTKKTILVEDRLVQKLIERVLVKSDNRGLCNVHCGPGGHNGIRSTIVEYNKHHNDITNLYVVFDGDQIPNTQIIDKIDEASISDINKFYDEIVRYDKLSEDNGYTKIDQKKDLLKFYNSDHVFYLPINGMPPERTIWDHNVANKYLSAQTSLNAKRIKDEITKLERMVEDKKKVKDVYRHIADLVNNSNASSNDIFDVEKHFMEEWIKRENDDFKSVCKWIEEILS